MHAQILAREIMVRRIAGLRADATITQAIGLTLDRRIGALPVADREGRLVGIVSEADLLRRGERGTERERPRSLQDLLSPGRRPAEYARACGRRVDAVMTRGLVTVGEEASLVEGVAPMERHRVKRLPVRCAARMVGIAACTDLVRTPAEAARARASAARRRRHGIRVGRERPARPHDPDRAALGRGRRRSGRSGAARGPVRRSGAAGRCVHPLIRPPARERKP
ncbi:CBS domain-containing protein [Methylobacterium currus]|uniref:CBS domain-containing protein n=1 Tax=Methylobacterium currus TaxID=2051553 RepID=A0A2R4WMN0_9HYPH|nr:CBS domain-containing protein [Methylobacterium currus]AWB22807.1 CBS domain-containing protein [Methylobacterium currus]